MISQGLGGGGSDALTWRIESNRLGLGLAVAAELVLRLQIPGAAAMPAAVIHHLSQG